MSRRKLARATAALVVTFAVLVGTAGSGGAAPARRRDGVKSREGVKQRDDVKQRFERAQAAYQRGDYREAIVDLEAAYLIDPRPIFLLNIGRCYRELGEKADAARLLRSYLEKAPEDPNRVELEATIRELEAPPPPARAPAPVLRAPSPPPPTSAPVAAVRSTPAPPPARPVYRRAWFWMLVGGVALGAAAGTTLWMRRDPVCPRGFPCQ